MFLEALLQCFSSESALNTETDDDALNKKTHTRRLSSNAIKETLLVCIGAVNKRVLLSLCFGSVWMNVVRKKGLFSVGPAHVGVKENEVDDKLVKEALKHHDIDIRVKQKSRR